MEDRSNNNDALEQFLRDEVSQHKMYPSDSTWENIRTELHGHASWPALTLIALFIISSLTVFTVFNYPPKNIIAKTNSTVDKIALPQTPAQVADNNKTQPERLDEKINAVQLTTRTIEEINNFEAGVISAAPLNSNNTLLASAQTLLANEPDRSIAPANRMPAQSSNPVAANNGAAAVDMQLNTTSSIDNTELFSSVVESPAVTIPNARRSKYSNLPGSALADKNENPVDAYLNDFPFDPVPKAKAKGRFELQFYATPSISFRSLDDDKQRVQYPSVSASSTLAVSPAPNINNAVRHTPALGFEVGVGLLYNITKNLKLKTGLQFNSRQYYIDAYQASNGVATIAIVQNNHLDSVNISSALSNSSGYFSTKLDNKLYQLSIPLGIQWDFLQGKKLGMSMGASIQPTFTLNKNVYLISTDYKYYANGAPFFRKWNMNTSIDLNFTYKTGNLKWYLGPQIRYQHLPTYNDVYPIKEYRWDYGVKIGLAVPVH